jgi:hypothetical protein
MGRFEIDVVLIAVQQAFAAGKPFADHHALLAHLRDDLKLGEEFLAKLTPEDLIDCLLQHINGSVPPAAPTPPPSSSRRTHSPSVVDDSEKAAELRPSFDALVRGS